MLSCLMGNRLEIQLNNVMYIEYVVLLDKENTERKMNLQTIGLPQGSKILGFTS
jgi:hypothetical protein